MSRLRLISSALIVIAFLAAAPAASAERGERQRTRPAERAFVPGELIVAYRPGVSLAQRNTVRRRDRARLSRRLPVARMEVIRLRPGRSVQVARRLFAAQREVAWAEPNYYRRARLAPAPEPGRYAEQWALENSGQSVGGVAGTPGADIDAEGAWDRETGDVPDGDAAAWDAAPTVGVIDSGVDDSHPDLVDNVDMDAGIDIRAGDESPFDLLDGHGTHVAGIIGARPVGGSSSSTLSGVSWRPRIVPIRVLDAKGLGTAADVVAGISYAGEQQLRVANISLGSSYYSRAEHLAINKYPRTLFVAAADNGSDSSDVRADYPCALSLQNLVCVAASDHRDAKAEWSNYGGGAVDIAAPGVSVLSTLPGFVHTEPFTSDVSGTWTTGKQHASHPDWAWSGDWGGDISVWGHDPGTANTWIDGPSFSLAGRTGCRARFLTGHYLTKGAGYLRVIGSDDDFATTRRLASYTGRQDGRNVVVGLSAFEGQPSVRLRFALEAATKSELDVWVSDLRVHCEDDQGDYAQAFGTRSGTSMAAPHVSGVAALLFARYPDASTQFVRRMILDGATPLAGWEQTPVRSGGRLSAAGAFDAAEQLAGRPISFDLNAPRNAARTTNRRPTLSWWPSDSQDGIDGYRLYVDGRLAADVTTNLVRNGTFAYRPSSNLGIGYHSWYVVAYKGASTRRSATRTFRVVTRPGVNVYPATKTGTRRFGCGGRPSRPCAYRYGSLQRFAGTVGAPAFTNGIIVRTRFQRFDPKRRRWVWAMSTPVTTYAARSGHIARFPDTQPTWAMRWGVGRYRVKSTVPATDITSTSSSAWRYFTVS